MQTLYEIAAEDAAGRQVLVCYASGTPSRRIMIRVMRKRVERLDLLTRNADWVTGAKTADGIQAGEWRVVYTGRTELEAQHEGELPHLAADGSIS